jgi:hypothetical protein
MVSGGALSTKAPDAARAARRPAANVVPMKAPARARAASAEDEIPLAGTGTYGKF